MKRREFLKILFSAAGAAVVITQVGHQAAEAAPVVPATPAKTPPIKTPESGKDAEQANAQTKDGERAGDEFSSQYYYRRRRYYYYRRPRRVYYRRYYRRRYW